jgi:hypothetical protein
VDDVAQGYKDDDRTHACDEPSGHVPHAAEPPIRAAGPGPVSGAPTSAVRTFVAATRIVDS